MEMKTTCSTPARAASCKRSSVPPTSVWRVLKGWLAQWTIVLAPRTAPARPSPVDRSPLTVPGLPPRLSTRTSRPAARNLSTTLRPSEPVPPVTRISFGSTSRPPFLVRQRRHGPELLGVDDDVDGPYTAVSDLEGRDALGTSVCEIADDTGPPVDPGSPDDESGWGLAEYPEEEAGDPVRTVDGVQRRTGLSPAIRPEGYVFGEHRDEAFHVAAQRGFEEAPHQALLLLRGALEAWPPGRDRVPRP